MSALLNSVTNSVAQCDLVVDAYDTPVTPGYGILTFVCSGAAFQPPQTQSGVDPNNYTPTFNLPQYYTALAITTASTCINYAATGEGPPTPITSGKQVLMYSTRSYLYCASYSNAPSTGGTLPSFGISWVSGATSWSQNFPTVTTPARTGVFQGSSATVVDANTPATPGAGTV
ncbi:hypothetical protein J2P12_08315, partial [Candidatus Bathyarchaeota archaeon]|nr:hypothetical protein [Candidatus Bathyarchaeota archaeon]